MFRAKRTFAVSLILLVSTAAGLLAGTGGLRMGDHLMKRGDYIEALEEYRKVLDREPENPEALWRTGWALTMNALDESGNTRHEHLEEATNKINRAVVASPDNPDVHLAYARALGHLALFKPDWDDYRVARRVREELLIVLEEEPENPEAIFLTGMWHRWVSPAPLLKRKPKGVGAADIDSALIYFRRAASLDEDNLYYRYHLAKAYETTGAEPQAREIYRELAAMEEVPRKYAGIPAEAESELQTLEAETE